MLEQWTGRRAAWERPFITVSRERAVRTIEDAYENAKPADNETKGIDCGSCRYDCQVLDTLLGVCGHEPMRKNSNIPETGNGEEEATT